MRHNSTTQKARCLRSGANMASLETHIYILNVEKKRLVKQRKKSYELLERNFKQMKINLCIFTFYIILATQQTAALFGYDVVKKIVEWWLS